MRVKRKRIILCVIVFVMLILFIVISKKDKKKSNGVGLEPSEVIPSYIALNEMNEREKEAINNLLEENLTEIQKNLKEEFSRVGMEFNKLGENEEEIKIGFGRIKDLQFIAKDRLEESMDVYDREGNKITEIEDDGTISSIVRNEMHQGETYLIKYSKEDSKYTIYFKSKLTSNGFKEFELFVISSNETSSKGEE